MPFFAHTGLNKDQSDWQPLLEHLRSVAQLAKQKAMDGFPDQPIIHQQAEIAGWLHDLGKYRPGFQNHLKGQCREREQSYHKQAGALLTAQQKHLIAALVIAGHHGGLPDKQHFREILAGDPAQKGLSESMPLAQQDGLSPWGKLPPPPQIGDPMQGELLTRIVFSLLVDADGQDTGQFTSQVNQHPPRPQPPVLEPQKDLVNLLNFVSRRSQATQEEVTKTARSLVLEHCLAAADQDQGIFSLRVPTGGGKTLSGLAFALKHAIKHRLRRILIVAPYLTILEQTASVVRAAIGRSEDWDYVLEHHSLADLEEGNPQEFVQAGRRGERWDTPIIITSNVQFWESLFGNKPGRCRKVHQMARSVILLDECQSIPPQYFSPACSMLKSLGVTFGSTLVLSTATQPAWGKRDDFPEGLEQLKEIVPPSLGLFPMLKRTVLTWPHKEEALTWEDIAMQVSRQPQALVMVNTRSAARDLFGLVQQIHPHSTFHLSTGLCPQHRREVLATVQKRLSKGEPCHLVATQVLEAGVDIDFPVVFRELAPLEAILQAAGRCNREGKLNSPNGEPGGKVRIFRSAEGKLPPDGWYKAGRSVLESVFLRAGRNPQTDDPELVEEYFKTFHAQGNLDKKEIQKYRKQLDFETVASEFQLIDQGGYPVVVATWIPSIATVADLLKLAKSMTPGNARRKLAAFQVNVRPWDLQNQKAWISEEAPGLFVYRGPYDEHLGLCADPNANQLLLI